MTGPIDGERRGLRVCAYINGYPAYALHFLLRTHAADIIGEVERSVERGMLPPQVLTELREQFADINEAGRSWINSPGPGYVRTAAGPVSTTTAVPAALSMEITTQQAGDMLHVQSSRVRKLIRAGHLAGHKVGSVWLVDRASVETYRRNL